MIGEWGIISWSTDIWDSESLEEETKSVGQLGSKNFTDVLTMGHQNSFCYGFALTTIHNQHTFLSKFCIWTCPVVFCLYISQVFRVIETIKGFWFYSKCVCSILFAVINLSFLYEKRYLSVSYEFSMHYFSSYDRMIEQNWWQ